jgi:DNA mismatch repair protein MutS
MKTGAVPGDDEELIARAGVTLPSHTRVTPMLRQWLQAKAKAKDAILLFRMGDFYELFGDDAKVAGSVLDLAVTTRDRDKGDDAMPMAGFPHPAAPGYIARLIAAGFKVAVCDQLEDPALAKGIVKRDVTRIVTPGMVIDEESLDAASNNFLVGLIDSGIDDDRHRYGLCALDVSTGELLCTTAGSEGAVVDEVLRLAPREVVLDEAIGAHLAERLLESRPGQPARRVERRPASGRRRLVDSLGTPDAWLVEPAHKAALQAAELCLNYAEETGQGRLPPHLRPPVAFSLDERLLLDATTRSHLALCGPPGDVRRQGTLLWHLDRTKTAAGGRRLLRRLLEPSSNLGEIEARLDRLTVFVDDPALRAQLSSLLTSMADVERLVARVGSGRAGPRELWRLGKAVARLPVIAGALVEHEAWADLLVGQAPDVEACAAVADAIGVAIIDEAPITLGDERAFREGYDAELDGLWGLTAGGQGAIAALEAREREQTGIPSLKVRFNSVFGYYIEVTKAHQGKVPSRYTRKQTVANGERYVTDELATLQEHVEGADARRRRREGELYGALLTLIQGHARALSTVASLAADVDATLSLAEVAVADRQVRPVLLPAQARTMVADELRHPVVERLCAERGQAFVPSSLVLDGERQVLVITGPNMAGKSTVMRQVAVCQLLAQAGAFVSAASAVLSVCDRIYTRVGADDDALSGRSTFMVEMTETSHILRGATPFSLVLLDEIGRGTSTFDGLAIAWAVAEHLHDVVGARTLFATHYHELTALDASLPRLKNVHVVVKEWGEEIVFVRTLKDGAAGRSFGIQVARLAGLPVDVVARAREVLQHLEGEPAPGDGSSSAKLNPHKPRRRSMAVATAMPQMSLFTGAADGGGNEAVPLPAVDQATVRLVERLATIDINRLTPLEGLSLLSEMVDAARRR